MAQALPLTGTQLFGVYVNLPLVAERLPPGGLSAIQEIQSRDFVNGFYFRSVAGAAEEMPSLVRAIASSYQLNIAPGIGLVGFSAGGSAVMLELIESNIAVTAAVVINAPLSVRQNVTSWEHVFGKTFKWDPASELAAIRYDVERHADKISNRPSRPAILFIQGDADEHLGIDPARRVNDVLRAAYAKHSITTRVELRIVPELRHNFGPGAYAGQPDPESSVETIRQLTMNWLLMSQMR